MGKQTESYQGMPVEAGIYSGALEIEIDRARQAALDEVRRRVEAEDVTYAYANELKRDVLAIIDAMLVEVVTRLTPLGVIKG